jgi:hypothetical protein
MKMPFDFFKGHFLFLASMHSNNISKIWRDIIKSDIFIAWPTVHQK